MKHSPYTMKDNFWSKQRIERGLTVKEIAQYLGKNEKTVSAYFTGFLLPEESIIRALCDLFGIDYHTGNLEFQHAHREYRKDKRELKYSAKKSCVNVPTKDSSNVDENVRCDENVKCAEDILRKVYGVLSCEDFIAVYNLLQTLQTDNVHNEYKIEERDKWTI